MTRSRTSSRVRRSLLRTVLLLLVLLAPVALVLLAVETRPRVRDWQPPDAAAAAQAREAAGQLRALVQRRGAGSWTITEAELNGLLASGERLVPGAQGRAAVHERGLAIDVAVGAPALPGGVWANLHLGLAPSDSGLVVTGARVGRLPLPAVLVEAAARWAIDRTLGAGAGTAAFASVGAVATGDGRIRVDFAADGSGEVPLFVRVADRGQWAGAEARRQAYVQLWYLDRAVQAGELPKDGSMLPYLQVVLARAAEEEGDARDRIRGALYALALTCGDPAFGAVVGIGEGAQVSHRSGCAGTTLGGRDDLRKHFAVSAGLEAATAGSAAFGVGELKELLDSNAGGSGFSFDDIAADAAGVALAKTLLAAPAEDWPGLADRIRREDDVLPAFADLPTQLSPEAFRETIGTVDSDAYAALIAEINTRVAALPVHGGGSALD